MSSETDEQVAHHAEVLMWHDTGTNGFATVAKQYAELFRQHVPDSGDAESTIGQVVLATSRLASEYRRNGNMNWGPFFEEFVDTLETTLLIAQTESRDQERVKQNLVHIRENGTDDLDSEMMRRIFGECIEDVVRFGGSVAT